MQDLVLRCYNSAKLMGDISHDPSLFSPNSSIFRKDPLNMYNIRFIKDHKDNLYYFKHQYRSYQVDVTSSRSFKHSFCHFEYCIFNFPFLVCGNSGPVSEKPTPIITITKRSAIWYVMYTSCRRTIKDRRTPETFPFHSHQPSLH